ncbi:MAG: metallophosphoesterase [Tissierellia bacterium]|nr:metallophosphoesterase [Tissierellia bacterium]
MIFTIGDLHFDSTGDKSMDIFGENWIDHEKRIIENWKLNVTDKDTVLVPGDISWALKTKEAISDLQKIENLPGKKYMIKGNHDYWWGSMKKLKALGFKTIHYVYNNSYELESYNICGTRAWQSKDSEDFDEADLKIFNRELNRLKLSLESVKNDLPIICMLHYPPFNFSGEPNEFHDLMKEYNIPICIYGHLHSEGHKYVKEGIIDGIDYICASCDYIDFKLRRLNI